MTTAERPGLQHSIGPDGLLTIRVRTGELRLRATDGPIVRIADRDRDDIADLVSLEKGDGSLAVSLRRQHSVSLDIEVPRAAAIVIETVSADIETTGLAGDQRYRTSSGDLVLRDAGGRIALESVSGDVTISATDRLATQIQTVSGDVELRAATIHELHATTTSGDLDIAAALEGAGPFRIETVSGDGVLAIDGDLRVETTTVSGDLHSDLSARAEGRRGQRTLVIGTGQPVLTFKSMSGDLSVVGPRQVRTADPTATAAARQPVAAPVEPRPQPNGAIAAAYDEARLGILQALERGQIDVTEAGRRFEALDGGVPDDHEAETARTPLDGSTDA